MIFTGAGVLNSDLGIDSQHLKKVLLRLVLSGTLATPSTDERDLSFLGDLFIGPQVVGHLKTPHWITATTAVSTVAWRLKAFTTLITARTPTVSECSLMVTPNLPAFCCFQTFI